MTQLCRGATLPHIFPLDSKRRLFPRPISLWDDDMTIRFSLSEPIALARYQKAPIYLHPTFFITAVMLAWPFWSIGSLRGLELAGLFIVVILGSVLLHELAHAVMAERYGLSALRIDIHALGGAVQFWYQPLKRSQDFAITLAGPMSNLAKQ